MNLVQNNFSVILVDIFVGLIVYKSNYAIKIIHIDTNKKVIIYMQHTVSTRHWLSTQNNHF